MVTRRVIVVTGLMMEVEKGGEREAQADGQEDEEEEQEQEQ